MSSVIPNFIVRIALVATAVIPPVSAALAQKGGKAEPKRIEIGRSRTGLALTGVLGNDQEMEYVFKAAKGQRAMVRNMTTGTFDVRLFSNEFGLETEFERSRTLEVDLPETGDYMLFVRKKAGGPRKARFRVTLSIN
jgi:hypothetical protein